jgi:gliding motility-associated-like protein
MTSDEAAASISDENGNLLFYTNGNTVYNKSHQVMLNGDNLDGYISATQIAIVPLPGSDSIYYIFTTGAIESQFVSGYKFSIVNMNRDNGKGEVISKNNLLWASCTERIATARHANGVDVWIITNDNNSNIFRAWLITCNGLQPAVVSTIGIVMDQHVTTNSGVLKVSPDGKYFSQTHFPVLDEIFYVPNFFQLFDFNNSTGSITNPRKIDFPDAQYTHCEFSPNSKLLYLTRPADKKVDQLNISLGSLPAILASRVVLPVSDLYYDIQLAPDEKIYIAKPSSELAVIQSPDSPGFACNLQEGVVSLSPGLSYLGLPSHINDIVFANDPNNGFTYTILDSCSGQVSFNAYTSMQGTISWFWDFGDGSTSVLQNPVHTFTPAGNQYSIRLKITSSATCGVIYRTKIIKPQGILANNVDFIYKDVCDSGYVRFTNTSQNLNDPGIQYLWDFGDGNFSSVTHPVHIYNTSGSFQVTLKMFTGIPCLDVSITKSVFHNEFTIIASPDQTIRVGESVILSYAGPPGSSEWTPPMWLNNSTSKSPVASPLENIEYKITTTNSDGCKAADSVKITVIQYDDIYVPGGFTPNNDGKNEDIKPYYPGTVTLRDFSIFNRWGQKVFNTSQRNAGWDGKLNGVLQATGVYVWTLQATDEKNGKTINKKGTVVLIR